MRTLNVRLAIILFVIVVVLGVGVYFLHSFQQSRNANFFLEQAELAGKRAEEAQKEDKQEEAEKALTEQMKNLEWYLMLRRTDMDALEKLGILRADNFKDGPTFRQAYDSLDRVVRGDPARKTARRRLIDLALLISRFSEARDHLTYLLKEDLDNPELLNLLGQCQEGMGEDENAVTSYAKAVEYSPKQIAIYPRLARLLRKRLERPKEADEYMQKMIENNPDSAEAYVNYGRYLRENELQSEAMKAAEKALELAPDDKEALLLAAECAVDLGDLEKARKYAEHCLELHKDSVAIYTALADIFIRSREREKAVEILDRGMKEIKNAPQILWFKTNLLIDGADLKAAEACLEKLRSMNYAQPLVDYLDARLTFTRKEWLEARRRFERLRPALLAGWPALVKQVDFWLGYCYGQLNNTDQEIIAYQRSLAADPFYAPARQYLTDALVKTGRVDEATQEYAKLIRMRKIPPSGLIVFASLLLRKNLELPAEERDWKQVETVLKDAEKYNPDAMQIVLLRTEMLHSQNRNAEAEKLLQAARDKNPKQMEYWRALIALLSLEGKWDQVEQTLRDCEQQLDDSVELRLARSEYLMRRYGAKAGEPLTKLEENIAGFSEAERIQLWNGLLISARRIGDKELADHYLKLLAEKDANNLEIQYLRMEQAANKQDVSALEKVLEDVEKIEGQGPLWLVGQARVLLLKAQKDESALLDEAEKYLTQAREIRPSWSRIPLLLGSLYDRENKMTRAVKNYMDAISMGERNPSLVRRTLHLLFQQQRYDAADKLLRQLDSERVPFTPELTRLWVQLLIQQGEFDMAVEKAREAVSEKSNDYSEHLWLGQILGIGARRAKMDQREKDYESLSAEAEKSLRRAVELKGDTAETWVSLVQFLSSVKKISEAEEVVEQARGKIPAAEAPTALAQCYEAIEKNDLATEQYKLALAAKPDDPIVVRNVAEFYQRIGKSLEAEALLKRILEGKVPGDEALKFWARRQLALITAAKGGAPNREAARALIEENLAQGGASPDDLRIKARFDALDPRPSRKEEAIDVLSKLMEGQQATPEDRFSLALLYLSMEKQSSNRPSSAAKTSEEEKDSTAWNKASLILRGLIGSRGNDPIYMATYVRALLDHGEVSNVELYLNKLVDEYPNYAATVALQAEMLVRRNRYDEALEVLKRFIDVKDAVPIERSRRIRMMAEVMEKLAEQIKGEDQKIFAENYLRTAELYFRQYIDEHPSQSADLIMFYIRRQQYDDALAMLEQYWPYSDPVSIGRVCISLVNSAKDAPEIQKRIEKVLAEAEQKYANHPGIILSLGDIRFTQGRYGEAESYYRQVLEKNPGHAVALNNLALTLALQGKKLDESLKLINNAIDIAGPLASMLDTRASVYMALGKAEEALNDIEAAVAETPTPTRLFHQAQALLLGNHKYAAISTMQRALKAGLKKETLEDLEYPAFDKLQKLAQEQGTGSEEK